MKRRARQVRDRRLQGIKAVVQRQQRMTAERHDRRCLGLGQHRRARLRTLRPSRSLLAMASAMFRDIWDSRIATHDEHRKAQKIQLKSVEGSIRKAADLLIATDSAATMRAIEAKIEKLEAQRALIAENLADTTPNTKNFDMSFRTAMNFLASPWKIFETDEAIDRQTVLELVFAAPIPYDRDTGFRTAKTILPSRC